ncbi:MAG: hypothetical protein JNM56_23415 [Planctomycetia bacterium]|nr:hypothetical protein [Planctomycetia bacterium]
MTTIGGIDLSFPLSRAAFRPLTLLDAALDFWPQCQYQGAEDEDARPVRDLLEHEAQLAAAEFFLYRDLDSVNAWDRDGSTPANDNTMIHILVRDHPHDAQAVQLTVVVDAVTAEIVALIDALVVAATDAAPASAVNGRAPRTDIDAQLRELGCALDRHQFYDLLNTTRKAFFPGWTVDELACHPHEAQEFCEIVRKRIGAPVPDHIVMRGLFNSRKSGRQSA